LLRKLALVLLLPAMVPVALLMRLLRPLLLVRVSPLVSSRIGHFAADTELYLCQRDAGWHGKRTLDIFYSPPPVSNRQLNKMWGRVMPVSFLARPLDMVSRRLPGADRHSVPMPSDKDVHGLLVQGPAHLAFTSKEETQGFSQLRSLGMPSEAPFICFYARDAAYLDLTHPDKSWEYHDYRDSCIYKYLPAVEEMTRRGYFAVRMGAIVKEALNTDNPMIIDYAAEARTDFLDIYLSAKCRLFLGDTGGLIAVPRIFRRPMVYANLVPLGEVCLLTCASDSLFIPKKHWHREDTRFLSFREIVQSGKDVDRPNKRSGLNRFLETEMFEKFGIDLVENSPEEIAAVTIEMDERLKGTWVTTDEDEQLQSRFWSLFKTGELHGVIRSRIGAEFLRQNRELLG